MSSMWSPCGLSCHRSWAPMVEMFNCHLSGEVSVGRRLHDRWHTQPCWPANFRNPWSCMELLWDSLGKNVAGENVFPTLLLKKLTIVRCVLAEKRWWWNISWSLLFIQFRFFLPFLALKMGSFEAYFGPWEAKNDSNGLRDIKSFHLIPKPSTYDTARLITLHTCRFWP